MMEEKHCRRIISRSNNNNNNNNNTDSVVDRISALPDCILGHILTFLPSTVHAVITCLVSKRWKFSWLDVHNLDFDFTSSHESEDSDENMAFIRFVNRVLLLTNGRQLNKFSLFWLSPVPSHVVCWIDAAILRNVHEINIVLGGASGPSFQFPISGFNCDSLRSLSLESYGPTIVCDTTEVCLPRLETLIVTTSCCLTSKEAFDKLFDGCPMLRHLQLSIYSHDDADEDTTFNVSSPSLTYLDMHFVHRCTLKLMAPSLEYLKLICPLSKIFVEKSLSSLVEAVLYCCYLQDFIHKSENLEKLEIFQRNWQFLNWWSTSDIPPRCLSKTLKMVILIGYGGLKHEHEKICFMLEHGIALEVVEIRCKDMVDGEKLLKEMREFPKKSPACKVSTTDLWYRFLLWTLLCGMKKA